ncbi:MAG: helix-turn-helix transcriptional regulator [Erysipelotrichales bacterium]|nr:helix-turn-helix transcriptional regulator [Erysipelotrichales bacterium]
MNKDDEIYVYYLISQNLKRIRKSKGITQEQLAEASTYSVGFIMNIESNKYVQTFSIGTLWQFAKVLDCDIREFFEPLDETHNS